MIFLIRLSERRIGFNFPQNAQNLFVTGLAFRFENAILPSFPQNAQNLFVTGLAFRFDTAELAEAFEESEISYYSESFCEFCGVEAECQAGNEKILRVLRERRQNSVFEAACQVWNEKILRVLRERRQNINTANIW